MASLNQFTGIGRLTRDPELKLSSSGMSVAKFAVAIDKRKKDDGANFFNVVCFKQSAEFASNYLKKGMLVCVTGSIELGFYNNKEGVRVNTCELLADHVTSLQKLEYQDNGEGMPVAAGGVPGDDDLDEADPFSDE